jgi:hypothetical protein
MSEGAIAWLRFGGCFAAGAGILLMAWGALSDVSTPGLDGDSERVVNFGLIFAALTKEVVGGFALIAGTLVLGFGLLVPKSIEHRQIDPDALSMYS